MKRPTKNNPSSTFFWKDYENDEGLRVSSLAAQGLWMRLLCVAAKGDPYGYVLINGCEIGVTGVARLGSVSETEAATLLAELERNGVFSRDRKGRILCRRMVKEAATREKNQKNGKKGGNPALTASASKQTEKSKSLNPPDNPPVKPPYPLPDSPSSSLRSEEVGGGGVRARGSVDDAGSDDLVARILHALGFDRGAAIPKYWLAPDTHLIVARWRVLLTDDEIVHVARQNFVQHGEPARGPKTLERAMSDFVAAKAAPPLSPDDITNPQRGSQNAQSDHANRLQRIIRTYSHCSIIRTIKE